MVIRLADQPQRFRHAQIRRAMWPLDLLDIDQLAILVIHEARLRWHEDTRRAGLGRARTGILLRWRYPLLSRLLRVRRTAHRRRRGRQRGCRASRCFIGWVDRVSHHDLQRPGVRVMCICLLLRTGRGDARREIREIFFLFIDGCSAS
jgi:hypothetical protein